MIIGFASYKIKSKFERENGGGDVEIVQCAFNVYSQLQYFWYKISVREFLYLVK